MNDLKIAVFLIWLSRVAMKLPELKNLSGRGMAALALDSKAAKKGSKVGLQKQKERTRLRKSSGSLSL